MPRFLGLAIAALLFASLVSAQGYGIRTGARVNLRTGPSLDYAIIETVAKGTILQVVGGHKRWLKIDRHGREAWMANWVRHERVEAAPAQPASDIDNCCFVDRHCVSDQDWSDGYWAFQNKRCAAPSQASTSASTSASTGSAAVSPGQVDNCCNIDRQCHSDEDWTAGYWAYQRGQCGGQPGAGSSAGGADNCCKLGWRCTIDSDWIMGGWVIEYGWSCGAPLYVPYDRLIIQGPQTFVNQISRALALLREKAPPWYEYVMNALDKIRFAPEGMGYGTLGGSFNINSALAAESTAWLASTIVHDGCHVQRWRDGTTHPNRAEEEKACTILQLEAVRMYAPGDHNTMAYLQELIANIHNPAFQWW